METLNTFLLLILLERLLIKRKRYKLSYTINKVRFRISIEVYGDSDNYLTRHNLINHIWK